MSTPTLNKRQQKLITKLDLPLPDGPEERTNPYTGRSCILNPLAVALYDFITESNAIGQLDIFRRPPSVRYKDKAYAIRDWDGARMIFRIMWPDEYMDLID
jgi:hypothetical protein